MCTIIVARRSEPDQPLLVGANRNEFLNRPASPPSLRKTASGSVEMLAPRDDRAGGTWLGINEHGLFVGLTNRFGPPTHAGRRSRGELVSLALEGRDARRAAELVDELPADSFNGFHLVAVDPEEMFVVVSDGELMTATHSNRRLTVVTELGFGAAHNRRKYRLWPKLRAWLAEDRMDPSALREVLGDREPGGGLEAVCVEMPEYGYGTRSSTIIGWGGRGDATFLHAHGSPCEVPYEDYGEELQSLVSRH